MKSQIKKQKVFVAMSGGVDSSVAAALLARSGNLDVVGCYMKCWSAWDQCSVERDAEDARAVAEKLGIPFYIFDFEREYRERVFDYMVREYALGRTPNPDVLCNSEIKFGVFLEKSLVLGADFVATGHYVREKRPLLSEKVNTALFVAKDQNKDQSYFLWRLTQEQLKHAIFPIGDYLKSEVREMARGFGLPTAEKKDSQGLCFVGKVDFSEFLRDILPKNPGLIITTAGTIIGEHDGLNFYTLGQRHGIKIGGGTPYYVALKEAQTNTLVVAEGNKDEMLFKKEIEITDVNWISPPLAGQAGKAPNFSFKCEARIRYRQPLQKCIVKDVQSPRSFNSHDSNGLNDFSVLNVVFDDPQKAATPGQSAVFYKDGELLGGGVIVK